MSNPNPSILEVPVKVLGLVLLLICQGVGAFLVKMAVFHHNLWYGYFALVITGLSMLVWALYLSDSWPWRRAQPSQTE